LARQLEGIPKEFILLSTLQPIMASYFCLSKSLASILLPVFFDNKALQDRKDFSFHIVFVLSKLLWHNQLLKFTSHASIIFLPNALNKLLSIQS